MDWSQYTYLIGLCIAALVALYLTVRFSESLMVPSDKIKPQEIIALLVLSCLGIAVVYGAFYLGKACFSYFDVGSDTAEQYVPYYINLLDSIRSKTLGFWNFEYGLGSSFMSYQSWTLDPFNLIVIPLGLLFGNESLSLILTIAQSLKVLCCALLFDYVLLHYCKIPLSRILGSILFAFCGFLMLWGQHYWLGSVLVMAIALTAALEGLMSKRTVPRILLVTIITAATIMMSTYSGFMVMVYATIYAVLRTIHLSDCKSLRSFLSFFVPLAVPVACGVLISLLTVIPYATLLLGESSRVSGGESIAQSAVRYLTDFVPIRWVLPIFSRMLGNGLLSIGADIPASLIPPTDSFAYVNVYEFIQLGFSAGCFILLGQFSNWVARDINPRDRVLIIIASLLCLLYCFNFFLPALFNVFVDPKYRSSFVLAIPVCIALACGWEHRIHSRTISKTNLAVCSFITIVVIVWSLINTVNGRLVCLSYLALTVAISAALYAINNLSGINLRVLLCITLGCVVSSSIIDAFFITNGRDTTTSLNFPYASHSPVDADTQTALNWIKEQDDGIYRIEKLYSDWTRLNDSLIQHYCGISSYNSTLDSDVIEFYQHLWPNILVGDSAYQEYLNDPEHPTLLRLLGVKYILSHDQLAFSWCEEIATFGNVYVYQVNNTNTLLTLSTGAISESVAESFTPEAREQLLSASAIVPDHIAESIAASPAQNPNTTYNGNAIESSGGLIINEPNVSLTQNACANAISGSFTALADNTVVCLAIPNTTGWTIEIDGEQVETYRANYGFIGFTVDSGEHTLNATYTPPNAYIGVIAAVIGTVGCSIFCLSTYKVSARKVPEDSLTRHQPL